MLVGRYTRLRVMDSTDAEYVRRLRNSPAVARNFQARYFISDVQQASFVKALAEGRTHLFFIGEPAEGGAPFGVFCMQNIDYRNQRGESGIFLNDEAAGDGVRAFEGIFLLLDYCFRYLNLRKVSGEVLPENTRAVRFNGGIGMQMEAVRRRHVYYDGDFHDLLIYSIFREDFYSRPTKIMQAFHDATGSGGAGSGSA
jgi:diamine N-acetyltransferase